MSSKITPKALAHMMRLPGGVVCKDRSTFFSKYPNCFVGRDAVNWMIMRTVCTDRQDAVALGRRLVAEGYIYRITQGNDFEDKKDAYYRFKEIVDDDDDNVVPVDQQQTPPETKQGEENETNEDELKPIVQIAPKAKKLGLPRLKGYLDLWEDSSGVFSSGWKKRFFVIERRTKRLLFYPENMGQALGDIPLEQIKSVGPTGEQWRFQIVVPDDSSSTNVGTAIHDPSIGGDVYIGEAPKTKKFTINARSKEELNFWVDGLIRWVAYFRTAAERKEKKKADAPVVDEKSSLLEALEQRVSARVGKSGERQLNDAIRDRDAAQREVATLRDQITEADRKTSELMERIASLEARRPNDDENGGDECIECVILRKRVHELEEKLNENTPPQSSENVENSAKVTVHISSTSTTETSRVSDDVDALKTEIAGLKHELIEKSKLLNENNNNHEEVEELQSTLEEQFQVMETMQTQLNERTSRVQELEAENELLLEKLAEMTIELEMYQEEEEEEEEENNE